MIKLSDYLNYLNNEVIQARQKADEAAVETAKRYAQHEYLKYFTVPRFTMPNVKLNIPLKISELNTGNEYTFKMDKAAFLKDANTAIAKVNELQQLKIPQISDRFFEPPQVNELTEKLQGINQIDMPSIEKMLNSIDFEKLVIASFAVDLNKAQLEALANIIKLTFSRRFKLVAANLEEVYIDPNTANESDKGKILLTLDVEMVEEGIRIHQAKDANGNVVEEIIFE